MIARFVACILWITMTGVALQPVNAAAHDRALQIAREVERLAGERSLWPGYDPLAIPLAIYDGERTFLFRHPSAPAGFTTVPDASPKALVHPGRHPAVVSNSSAEIGGTMTATLLADGEPASATELAAVALHEAFHVDQRRRHPGWIGNEGDLLLYPIEDARLLTLRRLESAALRRALATTDASAGCWIRRALAHRRDRFAAMDSAFSRYERLTELNEGLAMYVQLRAARDSVRIPGQEWRPAEIRRRTYATGPALGFLLDRFAAGWKESLEAHDDQFLDEILTASVRDTSAACALPAGEVAGIERRARADANAVVAERTARREAFDARGGWRVEVRAAETRPLWPQGFDPLNLERVAGGLLHTRMLQLQNDAGSVRMLDEAGVDLEALTEGAGPHPLFNGVRMLEIAGLRRPKVARDAGKVSLRAAGLIADFDAATVHEDAGAQRIEIQLTR